MALNWTRNSGQFRYIFHSQAVYAFRLTCKNLFYAFCYGNHEAKKVWDDFHSMYFMGGEL